MFLKESEVILASAGWGGESQQCHMVSQQPMIPLFLTLVILTQFVLMLRLSA